MAKVLNLAGYATCSAYQQAKLALGGLTTIFPSRFSVNIKERKLYFSSNIFLECV